MTTPSPSAVPLADRSPEPHIGEPAAGACPLGRRRLPFRREHPAEVFEHRGHTYRVGVGPRDDDTVAEIFLDLVDSKDKQLARGSLMQAFVEDCATLISIALQQGYTAEELARRLTVDGVARQALLIARGLPDAEFSTKGD